MIKRLSAELTTPAQSTDPFGPLDLSKHPLLPFDPEVAADMQERRNISKRLQNLDPSSQDSQQYLWSWTVYFIRHIGRPPLAAEVREAFKSAHPNLKAGGRTIAHGQGQEWLSVPAAMAVAFPLESFPSSLSIHM